jgi:hypothetical protein
MNDFKTDLFDLCKEVASEFEKWDFVSGRFINKSLKHTDLSICPSFGFDGRSASLTPAVCVENKRCAALFADLFKIKNKQLFTSIVNFQSFYKELKNTPEYLRQGCWIFQNKSDILAAAMSEEVKLRCIDLADSHSVLSSMMKDGIAFIEKYYDLSSEANLLKNLPPKYTVSPSQSIYSEMEMQKGVMMCVVHILHGDFDFVEHYASSDFKTQYPKRDNELKLILAALPELKRKLSETGNVI